MLRLARTRKEALVRWLLAKTRLTLSFLSPTEEGEERQVSAVRQFLLRFRVLALKQDDANLGGLDAKLLNDIGDAGSRRIFLILYDKPAIAKIREQLHLDPHKALLS
jgi:hypothetical protein